MHVLALITKVKTGKAVLSWGEKISSDVSRENIHKMYNFMDF